MQMPIISVCAVLAASCGALADDTKSARRPDPAAFEMTVKPLLKRYCFECHGTKKPRAGISFSNVDPKLIGTKKRKVWEKTLEMLEFGAMPPEDKPQPKPAELQAALKWIEGTLYFLDCEQAVDPGRLTVQRLNRNEYNNTIRDLFGVDLRPADSFPSDDVGDGFDNIGDVLSISPLLFEKYIDAAESVAQQLVVVPPKPDRFRKRGKSLSPLGSARLNQYDDYSLTSTGSVIGRFDIKQAGTYRLRFEAGAQQAGNELAKMEIQLGTNKIKTFEVKAQSSVPTMHEITRELQPGRIRLMASFVNDYYNPKAKDPNQRDRNLYIRSIEVEGPFLDQKRELPDSHKKLIPRKPKNNRELRSIAKANLKPVLQRAFRRPVNDDELMKYVQLIELAAKKGDSFEKGTQVAVTAMLVSPSFLFRFEIDQRPNDVTAIRPLTEWELATRLSYFLWSSMPDDELFRLAASKQLSKGDVLRAQVKRMLADSKSRAFVENFGGQWLNLRNLDDLTPDTSRFPGWNNALRNDMRQETLRFFNDVVKNDRSIIEFINAPYTFVNGRLAQHYGIKGVRGNKFQRVSLESTNRRGVLTHASILTLTSNPDRTSPVKRGKWIMDNILGSPPPEPPANVPELEATRKSSPDASLRKQLEIHRADPACATCHKKMDAIGFGFENFDAIGRWRKKEKGSDIDASGALPEGSKFDGPLQLIQILQRSEKDFATALSKKMLTYALGRGLEYYDRCAIDKIVKEVKARDYRFSELVTQIVLSDSFRKRRGEGKAK